jgi:hypothetical protein
MTTSNVLGNTIQVKTSLDDLFKAWAGEKKDEIKVYPEDILVLSCCLQRLTQGMSYGSRFNRSLHNEDLPNNVLDLDREKAKKIRQYYKDKLLLLTLRDQNLTKFRKDLQIFLYGEPAKVLDSHVGLVYKLPYFFDYDKEFDDIFQSSYFKNNKQDDMNQLIIRNLTFVKKIENQRKHTHSLEYWFTDDKLNKVMLDFPISNPLLSLLDEKINKGTLCITSKYVRRRKDLNEFFVCADKWVFA